MAAVASAPAALAGASIASAAVAAPPVAPSVPARYNTPLVRQPAPQAAPAPVQHAAAQPAAVQPARRPSPPPPPPKKPQTKFEALWDDLEGGKPLDQRDPINNFAPPPRMDWGPEKLSRKGRGLRRLRPTSA